MTINVEEKAIHTLAEIFHPQISNKLLKTNKIKVQCEIKNNFSIIKLISINKSIEKEIEIYDLLEQDVLFDDRELIKVPLQFKNLREVKGKWDKCVFTVDKDKKTTIEYIFPEKKMH